MARPQVADKETACNMEGSCEYIEKAVGQSTKGGTPAWVLAEVLTAPHRKAYRVAKQSKSKPRTWTVAQDKERWRALVTVVMNLRFP